MSAELKAWAQSRPLRGSRKQVLVELAWMHGDNKEAWPGAEYLADLLGYSTKTIYRAVNDLISRGYLKDMGRKYERGPRRLRCIGHNCPIGWPGDEPIGQNETANWTKCPSQLDKVSDKKHLKHNKNQTDPLGRRKNDNLDSSVENVGSHSSGKENTISTGEDNMAWQKPTRKDPEKYSVMDVIAKGKGIKKAKTPATLTGQMQDVWRKVLSEEFEVGYQPPFTGQELGQFKHIATKLGDYAEPLAAFNAALYDWPQFLKFVDKQVGLFKKPSRPALGLLLKHAGLMVEFYEHSQNDINDTEAVADLPQGKPMVTVTSKAQAQEKVAQTVPSQGGPATLDELEAIEQELLTGGYNDDD